LAKEEVQQALKYSNNINNKNNLQPHYINQLELNFKKGELE